MSDTKAYAASYLRRLIANHSTKWRPNSLLITQTKTFPNEVLVHDPETGQHWKLTVTQYRGPRRPLP
jgi:hypothetical protein